MNALIKYGVALVLGSTGSVLLWTGSPKSPDVDGSRAHARGGRNGLFGTAYTLKRALVWFSRVSAKTPGRGDAWRAGEILLDLV